MVIALVLALDYHINIGYEFSRAVLFLSVIFLAVLLINCTEGMQ
jgi:hypothetical protein